MFKESIANIGRIREPEHVTTEMQGVNLVAEPFLTHLLSMRLTGI